jgi:hypothetical protein
MLSKVLARRVACFATSIALLCASVAHAATVCVPQANGVPGDNGPPNWTVAGAQLDDPKWRGATREGFPNLSTSGATAEATSRLLFKGTHLYVSLQALVDTEIPSYDDPSGAPIYYFDAAYLGFRGEDPANPGKYITKIVRVALTDSSTADVFSFEKNDTAPWTGDPGVTWVTSSRLWVNETVSGATVPWAVNFDVDLSTLGLNNPRIWYAMAISFAADLDMRPYEWPSTSAFVQLNPPDTAATPDTWGATFPDTTTDSEWGEISLGTVVAACQGVKIEPMDIGTTNSPASKINQDADNTFRAQLTAVGSLPNAGQVRGRFRLANWGSTVGDNADWDDIPGGDFAANLTNNSSGLIQFTCPYDSSSGNSCPPQQAGDMNHQCMLVELQPVAGTLRFLKDSAYRNMDFAPASLFQREAEISIRGLPALATPERDVYLYVKTYNMPTVGMKDITIPEPQRDQRSKEAMAAAQDLTPTEQLIQMGQPTYEVHVYHDTGKGAAGRQLLEPQVPFGYFMQHQGTFRGWAHGLEGMGVTLQELAPNFYKVKVPNNGSVVVKTSIEAVEKPPICPPCGRCRVDTGTSNGPGLWLSGVAIGLFILRGVVSRRRRREQK